MSVQTTSSLKPPLGNNNYKFSVFLKRCTSIVHPHMYFVVQVEMQTCFVKIHTKWQISFARVLEDKFLGILSGHAQAHEIWHFLMKFSRMSFVSAFAISTYIYTLWMCVISKFQNKYVFCGVFVFPRGGLHQIFFPFVSQHFVSTIVYVCTLFVWKNK